MISTLSPAILVINNKCLITSVLNVQFINAFHSFRVDVEDVSFTRKLREQAFSEPTEHNEKEPQIRRISFEIVSSDPVGALLI